MRKLIGSVYEIEKHFEILNCFEIVIQCLTGLVFEMALMMVSHSAMMSGLEILLHSAMTMWSWIVILCLLLFESKMMLRFVMLLLFVIRFALMMRFCIGILFVLCFGSKIGFLFVRLKLFDFGFLLLSRLCFGKLIVIGLSFENVIVIGLSFESVIPIHSCFVFGLM